uniref:Uncharacterized protein n=1 Tax=Onchocerca volvulus TaxID=6282 RepID=A0A8R1Y567_ONCVO
MDEQNFNLNLNGYEIINDNRSIHDNKVSSVSKKERLLSKNLLPFYSNNTISVKGDSVLLGCFVADVNDLLPYYP